MAVGSTPITSILVIRFSSMGDIILTSPLLQELRAAHPAVQIDLLTKAEYRDLGHALGYDRVHLLRSGAGLTELVRMGVELRREKFSHVLDVHNNLRSYLIRFALAAPVGIVNKRTTERKLLVKKKVNFLASEPDVAGRYIEAAHSLGISDQGLPPKLKLNTPPGREPRRIAICPGAKHWNKQWPVERFAEAAGNLIEAGSSVVLIGGKEDVPLAEAIIAQVPKAQSLCGELSILESAAALSGCSLAITNDSGLMHLACAVGTPVISIFGATVPQFGFAPRNADSTILENKDLYCRPCTTRGLDHCPEQHFRCMKEIQVDGVVEAAKIHIPSIAR